MYFVILQVTAAVYTYKSVVASRIRTLGFKSRLCFLDRLLSLHVPYL